MFERGSGQLLFILLILSESVYIGIISGRWSGWSGGKAGSKQRRFPLPEMCNSDCITLLQRGVYGKLAAVSCDESVFNRV